MSNLLRWPSQQNVPLSMLKLSANRLTDTAVQEIAEALLTNPEHPLQLVDFMNNKVNKQIIHIKCAYTSKEKSLRILVLITQSLY